MKKSLFSAAFLTAACTVAFVSCKKDDDKKTRSRSELLVGTWNVNAYGIDSNKTACSKRRNTVLFLPALQSSKRIGPMAPAYLLAGNKENQIRAIILTGRSPTAIRIWPSGFQTIPLPTQLSPSLPSAAYRVTIRQLHPGLFLCLPSKDYKGLLHLTYSLSHNCA
jgi:hypothetical protein